MVNKKDKIILSDVFLRKDGFKKIMQRIKDENLKNIVIIGGSHSGFSAAWIMLNGPCDLLNNTHVKPTA